MGFADFVTATLILAGAAYLLYRSIWKKKGHCHGCESGTCRPESRQTGGLVRVGERRRRADAAASPCADR
jgi:hypothetical protein